MKEEKFYESPEVEIIEVAVEKGFAASGGDPDAEAPDLPWGDNY